MTWLGLKKGDRAVVVPSGACGGVRMDAVVTASGYKRVTVKVAGKLRKFDATNGRELGNGSAVLGTNERLDTLELRYAALSYLQRFSSPFKQLAKGTSTATLVEVCERLGWKK